MVTIHAPQRRSFGRRARRLLVLWAAVLYLVASALATLAWHKRGSEPASSLDRWGRHLLQPGLTHVLRDLHVGPTAHGLFPYLAALGSPRDVVVMTLLLALLSLAAKDWLGLAMCAVGPTLAVVLTEAVGKPVVHRVRDGVYQYPSGHCTGAAAVGALGLLLLYRRGGWRAARAWGWIFLIPPVLVFVAMQRLRLHDLTEAIGGLAVGTATVLGSTAVLTAMTARAGDGTARRVAARGELA